MARSARDFLHSCVTFFLCAVFLLHFEQAGDGYAHANNKSKYYDCITLPAKQGKARQESESGKEGSRRIKSERKTFETGSWKRLLLIIQIHDTVIHCNPGALRVKVISFQFMSLLFCFVGSCIFAFYSGSASCPALLSNKVHDLRTPSSAVRRVRGTVLPAVYPALSLVHGQVL